MIGKLHVPNNLHYNTQSTTFWENSPIYLFVGPADAFKQVEKYFISTKLRLRVKTIQRVFKRLYIVTNSFLVRNLSFEHYAKQKAL